MKIIVLFLCAIGLISCDKPGGLVGNQQEIETALSSLLKRQNEDAFVIFEDSVSKKFVQFAGSSTEPLLLDIHN